MGSASPWASAPISTTTSPPAGWSRPLRLRVPKGMRWYLVYRGFRTEQRDFAAFRRWIIRAATERAARRKGQRSAG